MQLESLVRILTTSTVLVALSLQPADAFWSSAINDYNKAVEFQQQGRIDQAELEYKKALKKDPNLAEAHLNLGNIYLEKSWYDGCDQSTWKAIAIMERTKKTMVDGQTYQQVLSVAYNNLGAVQLAKYIDQTAALKFASAKAHGTKATAHFKKAIQLDPSNANAQGNLQRIKSAMSI